jgi:methionyl aminopeptidase
MIFLKTPDQIQQREYSNKMAAEVLLMCYDHIKPGVSTIELEEIADKYCKDHNVLPSFKGYLGFTSSICVSINEEMVHGRPSEKIIKNGDLVSVDFGINRNGYYSDTAFTKIAGSSITKNAEKLVQTTEKCLYKGIENAKANNRIYDISYAIQSYAEQHHFNVVRDFVGHGVGLEVHEEPKIPNFVANVVNWKLRVGMVIAIEPIVVEGSYEYDMKDEWTVATKDGKLSAHFEHSIAILDDGPKILSKL